MLLNSTDVSFSKCVHCSQGNAVIIATTILYTFVILSHH